MREGRVLPPRGETLGGVPILPNLSSHLSDSTFLPSELGLSSDPILDSEPDAYDHVETIPIDAGEIEYLQITRALTSREMGQGVKSLAQKLLDGCPSGGTVGYCSLVKMAGNKKGGAGYPQLSFRGQNKLILLHHVSLAAAGGFLSYGEHASHLCGQTKCRTVGHVVVEDPIANNARKGCLGWIVCPHCKDKVIVVCPHEPICIPTKSMPGYASFDELLGRGVCARQTG